MQSSLRGVYPDGLQGNKAVYMSSGWIAEPDRNEFRFIDALAAQKIDATRNVIQV